jgi:hypothetical protein
MYCTPSLKRVNDMPYCVNCGDRYNQPIRYCNRCGRNVTAVAGSFASDSIDASTRDLAYERSYWHLRRKNRDAADSNESLQMYVSCIAVVGFLHGLALMMRSTGMLKLLEGPLGWLLLMGIVAGAVFKLLFDLRYGYSATRSLIEIVFFGVLTYSMMFGIFWYLTEHFMKAGTPIFTLPRPTTPTP